MKRTSVFLNEEEEKTLNALSHSTGAPVALLIRRAIDKAYIKPAWSPEAEKRKNRSDPVGSFEELRILALKMNEMGHSAARSSGMWHNDHLWAAKTWAHNILQKSKGSEND